MVTCMGQILTQLKEIGKQQEQIIGLNDIYVAVLVIHKEN